ncbi:MAG: beta-glucosidase [Anaerolineae bacterium]|nr:beta-glucosidase [Anaerolineae bacterium]
MAFSKDFVWGVAAASYQVEGAYREDGKGLSVWDMFTHRPGKVWSGHTGDVACDHYHRYAEDVALMKALGFPAYRLSIGWPRVVPDGVGKVNAPGLDFYNRLIDALLAAGITPYVTLFHWDFPYALYCKGGWLNRDSADWFAEYVAVVVRALGDRVTRWITLNEPSVFITLGHQIGEHAPGDKLGDNEWFRAMHHANLAHGKAVQAIRAASPGPCQVGYAPNMGPALPADPAHPNVEALRKANFAVSKGDHWSFALFNDPIVLGEYPADARALYGDAIDAAVQPGDMAQIRQPLDFMGLNIYTGYPLPENVHGDTPDINNIGNTQFPMQHQRTLMEWAVEPDSLYWGPTLVYERYRLPIYITENGMSGMDWVTMDGKVHDPYRVDFLKRYLTSLHRAMQDGADVRGYFQWSFSDNFEWAQGTRQRFGLVYIDYATQQRIPKDSAYWYGQMIASGGEKVFE